MHKVASQASAQRAVVDSPFAAGQKNIWTQILDQNKKVAKERGGARANPLFVEPATSAFEGPSDFFFSTPGQGVLPTLPLYNPLLLRPILGTLVLYFFFFFFLVHVSSPPPDNRLRQPLPTRFFFSETDQGRPDAVLFVVGSKGAGKTTLVSRFLYPDKARTGGQKVTPKLI